MVGFILPFMVGFFQFPALSKAHLSINSY